MSITEGFTVIINNISLFDYIQLIKMTGKTRTIEIDSQNRKAIIQIVKGSIEFAKTDNTKGKDAFLNILTWKKGSLKELNFKQRLKKNITDRGGLLLEAAEYIDKMEFKKKEKEKNKYEKQSLTEEELSKFENAETLLKNEYELETIKNEFLKEDLTDTKTYSDEKESKPKKKINKFKKCEMLENCEMLKHLKSEVLINAWISSYCSIKQGNSCARKKILEREQEPPKGLLPNGKIREMK